MKIKRCPICNEDSRLVTVKRPEGSITERLHYVQCKSCGIHGNAFYAKEGAISEWNQETTLETACKQLILKIESGESFKKEVQAVKNAIR